MKNSILFTCLLFTIYVTSAQVAPIDFEDGGNGASWTWTVFENGTNPPLEMVENPDASVINSSATVAKFTALQVGEPHVGCETQHGSDIGSFTIGSNNHIIKIMVWKSVISDVGIKLVRSDNWALPEIKIPNTLVNEWEEITFDFSAHMGNTYDQIVIFPDFNARTSDNIIYFDNITFGAANPLPVPMEPAPTPTIPEEYVISMFSNAYTDVPVDTWKTDWSVANYSELQIQGNDTKKYENLDFVGIETVGPNLIDASEMTDFHIDVWTPNMTTFKVKLVDFGANGVYDGGGDDSEHEIVFDNHPQETWVSHTISLDDFAGLNSLDNIAQLILSGSPVGSGTIYVDNVYFSNFSTSNTELNKGHFQLFPNPAKDVIRINSKENIQEIQVYNLTGKLVMHKNIQSNIVTLDIAHLAKGSYTLVAVTDDKVVVDKFIRVK